MPFVPKIKKILHRFSLFHAQQPSTNIENLSPLERMNIVQKEWLAGDGLDVIKELKSLNQQPIDASSGSSAFAPDEDIEKEIKEIHTTQLIEYNNHLPQATFVQAADKFFHRNSVIPQSITIKQDVYDKLSSNDYFSIVGHGTTELFNASLQSIIKSKGDVVIVTSPTYGLFIPPIIEHDANIEVLPLSEKNKYKPSPQELTDLIKATNGKLQETYKKKVEITLALLQQFFINQKLSTQEKSKALTLAKEIQKRLALSIPNLDEIDKATVAFNDFLSNHDAVWKEKLQLPLCPRVRAYFHINPHMPLGTICSQTEINNLAKALEPFSLTVIDDLTYYELLMQANKSPGTFANSSLKNRTLTLYSLSKQYALAGIRAGIALGAQTLIQPIAKHIFNHVNTPNTFSMEALHSVFKWNDKKRKKYLDDINEEYAFRRDFTIALTQGVNHIHNKKQVTKIKEELASFKIEPEEQEKLLQGIEGLKIPVIPESGFFLLIDFSHYQGKYLGTTILKQSRDFRNGFYRLADVNTLPGELMFEFEKPILRFSYSMKTKEILEAIIRMKGVIGLMQNKPFTAKEIQEIEKQETTQPLPKLTKTPARSLAPVTKKAPEKRNAFTPSFQAKRKTEEEKFYMTLTKIMSKRAKGKRKIKTTKRKILGNP